MVVQAYILVQTDVERDALIGAGVEQGRIVLQGLGVDAADCTGGDRAGTRRRFEDLGTGGRAATISSAWCGFSGN